MKALQSLNKYLLRYKFQLLIGVVFVTISNWFAIYPAIYVRKSFDEIIHLIETKTQDNSLITWYFILIFGSTIINCLFKFLMRQTIIVVSRKIEYDLKNDIFAHYLTLPSLFYRKNRIGDLMNRISEDVSQVRNYLGPGIMYSANLIVLITLVVYQMFNINPTLSIYVLLPLPLLAFCVFFISKKINEKSGIAQRELSLVTVFCQELMAGVRLVKNFGLEKYFSKKFEDVSENYRLKKTSLSKTQASFIPLILLLVGLCNLPIFYIGGKMVIAGTTSPGVLAEFMIYLNLLVWPVTSIGWVSSLIQRAEVSQKRINEFLKQKSPIINNPQTSKKPNGNIKFEKVYFSFEPNGKKILTDINLEIKQGETIAIVGKIGSGKSTLIKLIQRIEETQSGKISIGEHILQDYDLELLRQNVGYVSQDTFLFSGTIEDNIKIGRSDATLEEVMHYARIAGIHDNIILFSKGYKTQIGEEGVMLSGGQKQRISIARTLISKPDTLLLDDCFSAVDSETEQNIINSLTDELKDKTTIIVTHRASITSLCDKIVVMEDGQIIEKGNYSKLMAEKKHFYNFAKLSN